MRSAFCKITAAVIVLLCVQLACGPLNRAESTPPAPQQVIVIVPGDTSTPLPTLPPTPQPTITAVPLFTAGPTPSPTPDLRLILGEPEDFQLTLADLPASAGFRLLEQGSSIDPTERDEAWEEQFEKNVGETDFYATMWERDRNDQAFPDILSCDVGKFTTVPYARAYLKEYNLIKDVDRANGGVYQPAAEEFPGLGDARNISYWDYQYQGNTKIYYVIMVAYRNFIIECWGGGLKVDVAPDFIAELVQLTMDRMKACPLLPPPSDG